MVLVDFAILLVLEVLPQIQTELKLTEKLAKR